MSVEQRKFIFFFLMCVSLMFGAFPLSVLFFFLMVIQNR